MHTSTSPLVCSKPLIFTVADCLLPLPEGNLVGFQLMALFTMDLQTIPICERVPYQELQGHMFINTHFVVMAGTPCSTL